MRVVRRCGRLERGEGWRKAAVPIPHGTSLAAHAQKTLADAVSRGSDP